MKGLNINHPASRTSYDPSKFAINFKIAIVNVTTHRNLRCKVEAVTDALSISSTVIRY